MSSFRASALFSVLLAAFILTATITTAQAPKPAPTVSEARGIWVTRWDYRTPADVKAIIRNVASHNFNIVYFQVRGECTAFYNSSYEPWAWELTGKTPQSTGRNPGWDPLALAVSEAHKAGIELHAWTNVLPVWKQETLPPKSSQHIIANRPDWAMYGPDGKPMEIYKGFYIFLNPAHPEVITHLSKVFNELASKYKLDGIHLDYIRYPKEYYNGAVSYDPISLARFKQQYNATPQERPAQWNAFRRDQVTNLVKRISKIVKAQSPNLMLSSAVCADYERAVGAHRQMSLTWLNEGYIDCIVPMNYTEDMTLFRRQASLFMQNRRRGLIYMGMEVKRGERAILSQIALLRKSKAHGMSFFDYADLFPQHKPSRLVQRIKQLAFKTPAHVTGRKVSE